MEKSGYTKLAYNVAGDLALSVRSYFDQMKITMKKADIKLSLPEYLATAIFTTMLSFLILAPFLTFIFILALNNIALAILFAFVFSLMTSSFIFVFFYLYPTLQKNARAEDIDHNLPFATMYLSTLAGSGSPPSAIFDLLSEFKEYGEASVEASKISRDVNSFGADIETALKRAADRTPSEKFRDLLWGMVSVITAGGDLREYLRSESDKLMGSYRRELDKFNNTLSLLVEIYITLVIVGSIFLIIMTTIMGSLGAGFGVELIAAVQMLGVFVMLPLSSVMFIVLVQSMSPLSS